MSSALLLDPATLPAPLLRSFGGARDVFLVRILSRSVDEAIGECAWRARGQWDCNEREGVAAYHALAACIRAATGREPVPFEGWGADDYARFMARA